MDNFLIILCLFSLVLTILNFIFILNKVNNIILAFFMIALHGVGLFYFIDIYTAFIIGIEFYWYFFGIFLFYMMLHLFTISLDHTSSYFMWWLFYVGISFGLNWLWYAYFFMGLF